MPFGLKTAAQTFQRLMDSVTAKLSGVFVYLDDVLVASASEQQHAHDLRQLFSALKRCGLVLNEGKCTFGVREIKFLGHRVSAKGIAPLPGKVEAVQQYEQPQSAIPWSSEFLQEISTGYSSDDAATHRRAGGRATSAEVDRNNDIRV